MQTKFFPPRFQGVDGNGDVIVGSVGFYQTGTTTKITTYSDYNRATANANPLNTDSNGRLGPVFFDPSDLSTGVKVVFYDAADGGGSVVYTDDRYAYDEPIAWSDISSLITQARVGEILYPRTQAEIDASVTPTDYSAEPGYAVRYGVGSGSTAAANQTGLQAALNVARQATANKERHIILPGGQIDIAGPVYGQYDASNNAVSPSDDRSAGRITIEGQGCGDKNNAGHGEARGTVLNFTATTGNQFVITNYRDSVTPAGIIARGVCLANFAIWGATTGILLYGRGAQWHDWKNLVVFNSEDGTTIDTTDGLVFSRFKNIQVVPKGDGTGTGWVADWVVSGGGSTRFDNVVFDEHNNSSTGGFAVNMDLGSAYDGSRTAFAKNVRFHQCAFQDGTIQLRIRHGLADALFDDCWWEGSTGASGRSVVISDSAGFSAVSGEEPMGLTFRDCHFADVGDNTSGRKQIVLGSTGGNDNTDSHGPVSFIRPTVVGTPSNVPFITKYNNTYDQQVLIENPIANLTGNGYLIMHMSDTGHYGPVKLVGVAGLHEVSPARWTVDSGGTDLKGRWLANGSDMPADLVATNSGSPDYDYSNAPSMPSEIFSTVGAGDTQTVYLPNGPRVQVGQVFTVTVYNSETTNLLIFDARTDIAGTPVDNEIIDQTNDASAKTLNILPGSSGSGNKRAVWRFVLRDFNKSTQHCIWHAAEIV